MHADLRQVRTFKQLVRYLEDELGWPLDGYEMEDLTFDYEPADLGIKDEDAAKVKTIRQLRPLASDQPWGIFFIEFDKKKLPVVLLRRILSHLVVKKRASANRADRAAWNAEDLLFVSAFGPEDDDGREIGFAHFHQESGDLPSLRVLGWDGADTSMKLNTVAATLRERLSWPEKGEKLNAWQQRWAGAFKHRIGHVIRTSDMLAEAMAALAKRIRDAATTIMQHETESGPLTKLHRAFQTNLIHDLTAEGFADTYAQTITYGLFIAALSKTDMSGGRHGTALIASNIVDMVPVTNPFLKEMLATFLNIGGRKGGIDFDELGIQDVVELLRGDETDLPAIRDDFGNRTRGEDPVIHFYEHFLSAYNKKLKIQRGVFYTPQPVVSYIVRSVHELLQTEFGLEDGLADTTTWGEMVKRNPELKLPTTFDDKNIEQPISEDEPFVQILDPATGTATFLVEVIAQIAITMKTKWGTALGLRIPAKRDDIIAWKDSELLKAWNDYVPQHLLPRLHAFELMMAPYAIAHMKIGLKLAETGYRFGTEERARIYLTNALEPWVKQLPLIGFDALAHEAAAVNEIKRHKRFTVVIGNPPYSIKSCNMQASATALVEPFRFIDGEKIRERGALKFETILQDDYVKFWGLGLKILRQVPTGIIGMITNNGFFTNRVLRGMRKELLNTFDRLSFCNLHGNRSKGEKCPDGSPDENVFDIDQGVGVSVLRKAIDHGSIVKAESTDLWGLEKEKCDFLNETDVTRMCFEEQRPKAPYYLIVVFNEDSESEYRSFAALDEAMPFNKAGFVSGRDDLVVDFETARLESRIDDFLNPEHSDAFVRERYSIKDAGGYQLTKRRQPALAAKLKAKDLIQPVQHRPFDYRFVAYSESVLTSPQKAAMRQLMTGENIAFCLSRGAEIIRGWEHIFCTKVIIQHHTVSLKEVNYAFPLYLFSENGVLELGPRSSPNFSMGFAHSLAATLCLPFDSASNLPAGLTPEDIFHYAYAVFHSPGYRSRYAEFLKIDFPRLPLIGNLELFRALARLGGELTALHLLESSKLAHPITEFIGTSKAVTKVGFTENTVWIDASGTKGKTTAGTSGFRGVPEAVWNFHIGGYQVCEKWLKDRKGRTLTTEDIAHYHKIVVALTETIRLMAEIDDVIEEHGGWPGAFASAAPVEAEETAIPLPHTENTSSPPSEEFLWKEDELPLG